MGTVHRHLGAIGSGWRNAWRGWRDNPLWAAWERSLAQREERLPWWRLSPGLTILGVVLALAATTANVLLLLDTLGRFNRSGERPFIAANLSLAVGVCLACGLLFSLCWLAARLFRSVQFALGFLEREPRQRFRQTLDDMLAVSSLSEQELLIGCTWYGVRQLAWPLLACCACLAVLAGRLLVYNGWTNLALTVALFLLLAVGGLLAATALILLALGLSLTVRAGVLPSVGGVAFVLMQPLYIAAGILFVIGQAEYGAADQPLPARLGYGAAATAIFLLTLFLGMYLARRLNILRMALAGGLPLVLALPYGLIAASLALSMDTDYVTVLPLAQPLSLLTLFNPELLTAFFRSGADNANALGPALSGWLVNTLFQLLLIWVAAELARDAVRRRKWGEAG